MGCRCRQFSISYRPFTAVTRVQIPSGTPTSQQLIPQKLPDFFDDVSSRDPEAFEKFLRFSTAWNLADSEFAHADAIACKRRQNSISQSTMRIVVFHREHASAACFRRRSQRLLIDGHDAEKIDHANECPCLFEFLVSGKRLKHRDSAGNHQDLVLVALL